ncbi:hypothetical protein GCM10011515_01580 [Tsuneonella deserti]|uniref:Phosphatidic acid phosphatase type 2/haloperoxidase domain-containing protein n=1 Tax=Tsuneonella deserti TaxID=2035528 RepID=A0ABQ1RZL9_9SPHN|nr:phosphatase PAP2 family protein [Tsuneonella deserti]GGD85618.1 hypothetical protein GCM10011515_01580 [Tsuneonella deserti]
MPYRCSAPVRAIDWFSQLGDQAQMRLIAGGVVAAGLVRRDVRMIGAGVRMLAAHEVATTIKRAVKERVIRSRPRSAGGGDKRPHKGKDMRKEKSSFPSGHAAGATAGARAFAAVYPDHSMTAHALAGAVSLGRIPGCAHYPSDVAAGVAIGASASATVTVAWRLVRLAILRR